MFPPDIVRPKSHCKAVYLTKNVPKGAHGSMLTCLFILHAMGGLDPPGSFLDPPGRSWAVMAGQVAGHGHLDLSRPPNWALLLLFSL